MYYIVQFLGVIFTLSIVVLPFIGPIIDPLEYHHAPPFLPVLMIIGPVVIFLFYGLRAIKKAIDPYFHGY